MEQKPQILVEIYAITYRHQARQLPTFISDVTFDEIIYVEQIKTACANQAQLPNTLTHPVLRHQIDKFLATFTFSKIGYIFATYGDKYKNCYLVDDAVDGRIAENLNIGLFVQAI